MDTPDAELVGRVERLLHRRVDSWSRIRRGYTPAERWLRREYRAYERIKFFAARAGLPEIPDAPLVRSVQRRQLSAALPWAMRALQLSP